ncbi:MAG: hypothetical protein ACK4FP_12375 [Azonexus sp.]
MSILQDLDPQYAKLHRQPSAFPKTTAWLGALLLVVASAYWLAADRPVRTDAAGGESSLHSMVPDAKSAAGGATERKEIPALSGEPPAVQAAGRSATIHESVSAPRPGSDLVQENARSRLADVEYREPKPVVAPSAKPPKRAAPKTERPKVGSRAPQGRGNEKKLSGSIKPMQERDVDIITAIVR